MPCSEPRMPELDAHRDKAIPLLCALMKGLLEGKPIHTLVTRELREWWIIHSVLDNMPGGANGYAAGDAIKVLLRAIEETKK